MNSRAPDYRTHFSNFSLFGLLCKNGATPPLAIIALKGISSNVEEDPE